MIASYSDERYQDFIAKGPERRKAYAEHKAEILNEYNQQKELYKKVKEESKEKIAEYIQEGYTERQARKLVKPALYQMKERLDGEREKMKLALSKNRVLIYPFHLFYRPVEFDGNGLLKPRFRVLLSFLSVLAIGLLSLIFMQLENAQFRGENLGIIISMMFRPDDTMVIKTWTDWFSYMFNTAIPAIWKTFQMMFIATAIGSILAIPFMILCSENIVKHKSITRTFRVILNTIRTFPTMVLGVIGVAFFGIGTKAGIFAMVVFTMGIMIKLMYERIETVDMHPFEAAVSTGGSKPKAFVTSIAPQILPDYLSNVIYTFEINIRASVILGFVNAGGIGKLIQDAMNTYEYNQIGAILVPLLILVLVLTWFSSLARRVTQ